MPDTSPSPPPSGPASSRPPSPGKDCTHPTVTVYLQARSALSVATGIRSPSPSSSERSRGTARTRRTLSTQPVLLFPSEEWQCPRGHCMGIRLEFRKSSYSAQGQECVEVAHIPANFRKSSYSGRGQNCVE